MLACAAVDASSEVTQSANDTNRQNVISSLRTSTLCRVLLVRTMRPRYTSCRTITCNRSGLQVRRLLRDAFVGRRLDQRYAPEAEEYEECEADADVVVDDEVAYQPAAETFQVGREIAVF